MIDQLFMIFLVFMTIGCNIPMPKDLEMYEDEKGILHTQKKEILIVGHLLQENIKLVTRVKVQTLLKNQVITKMVS